MTTTARTLTLTNGQRAVSILGAVMYAAEVEGMDPEAVAALYTDLTAADVAKVLRVATPDQRESEWLQDWAAAVRWHRTFVRRGGRA